MMRRHWLGLGIVVPLFSIAVAGCGYLDNEGDPRENIKPEVFVTNFPASSKSAILAIDTSFRVSGTDTTVLSIDTTYDFNIVTDTIIYLANPRIYWFGTDIDGRVSAFEYAVVPTDSLAAHPAGLPTVRDYISDNVKPLRFLDTLNTVLHDSLDWIELLPPNLVQSATVFLFADIDTSIALDQFLFVRSIDNEGLRSDIAYARFSRQNHPPATYINLDTIEVIQPNVQSPIVVRSRKYFSLPQSTATYPGITIGWFGSDSTDYPDEQPPFDFNWILYGPYPDQVSALPDSSKLLRTNDNRGTPRVEWTTDDRHTFFNLRTGWYVFEVRARDDAFVADPDPTIARFEVVEPSFDKDFLLMDASNWTNGRLLNCGSYFLRNPRCDSLTVDTLRQFYVDLFTGQGYDFNPDLDFWIRQLDDTEDSYAPLPDRDIIGQYKAVVLFDEDLQITLDVDNLIREYRTVLSEYLNVGGRVVLIGRNLFGSSVTGWSPADPPLVAQLTGADFGFNFFGVTHMYFPGSIDAALKGPPDTALDISDFTGTLALDPTFPEVSVDTFLTLKYSQLPTAALFSRAPDCDPDIGTNESEWLWMPDVNWIGIDRNRGAEGFYQFNSVAPNTSPSQGRICGARYEYFDFILNRNTYRTAIVTFPFSTLKRDGSIRALVKELLDYILE